MHNFKKVIKNNFENLKNPNYRFKTYKQGCFGKCKGLVVRIEFQDRGTIHYHMFVFIEEGEKFAEIMEQEERRFDRQVIQLLLGEISNYNTNKVKDQQFLLKYDLYHHCSKERCWDQQSNNCREGFPFKQTQGYYLLNHPVQIQQRRINKEDEYVITFSKWMVKYFRSNCQLTVCQNDKVLGYLTKYFNKNPQKLQKKQNANVNIQFDWQKNDHNLMGQISKFLENKVTSLQEALLAFHSIPLIETTYRSIKIKQEPISKQINHQEENVIEQLTVENIQDYFDLNQISNSWYRYLYRPTELEDLNFVEYSQATIFHGKRKYQLCKLQRERERQNVKDGYLYLFDKNSNIIKIKQKKETTTTIIQTSFLHPSETYQGPNNVYYLQMLQLFWPHRKEEWIKKTQDNFKGYEKTYHELLNSYNYNDEGDGDGDNIKKLYRNKYTKFLYFPFRNYIEEYNNLRNYQLLMLDNIYKFRFYKNNVEIEEKSEILSRKFNYIKDLLQLIEQKLSKENEYQKVGLINQIVPYLYLQSQLDELGLVQIKDVSEEIILDVKKYWDEMNNNTKNIIINLGLILKEFGDTSLWLSCPKEEMYSQHTPKRQQLIYEQQQSQVSLNKFYKSQLLTRVQDEIFENDPAEYRNIITKEEEEEEEKELNKIKRQLIWNWDNLSIGVLTIWSSLNSQQRLSATLMLKNLYQTFSVEQKLYEGTFVHGAGGVGKSFLIMFLIALSKDLKIQYTILCPTQQAVQNIQIMCQKSNISKINISTIHSFFRFNDKETVNSLWQQFNLYLQHFGVKYYNQASLLYRYIARYKFKNKEKISPLLQELDMILIEEISMIDPIFLNLLDVYCQISRKSAVPFGGLQVFLFGDSFQLQAVQQTKSFYFDSAIFNKKSYFKNMIELTQSVRQLEDLDFFLNILQPLRKGQFHHDTDNFKIQIKKLQERVIPQLTIGPIPIIRKQLEQLQLKSEQIICLFFDNESAQLENQRKAQGIIDQFEGQQKSSQNKMTQALRYQQYIIQPLQFSFQINKSVEELDLLNLGQTYSLNEQYFEQSEYSYYSHYLLLPVGLRNYLAKKLGKISHEFAIKQKDFNKTQALLNITLFRNADVIFRKNIDKSQAVINGQNARIKDLLFDVDYKSQKNMEQFVNHQKEYIQKNNFKGVMVQFKKQQQQVEEQFSFTKNQMDEISQFGLQNRLNNVNNLMEYDITIIEKTKLYQQQVDPRLTEIVFYIENIGLVKQKLYLKKCIQEVNIEKVEFVQTINHIIHRVQLLLEEMIKLKGKLPKQQKEYIYRYIKNNNLLPILYLDIITGQFSKVLLEDSVRNLKGLLNKMNDRILVYLHQIPINLGYARTIHTAQGATIQNIIIDLDIPIYQQHGLLYTALSRVRKLNNLFFKGRFDQEKFKVRIDERIEAYFLNNFIEAEIYLNNQDILSLTQLQIQDIIKGMDVYCQKINNALMYLNKQD